jgi:hypothetical protein
MIEAWSLQDLSQVDKDIADCVYSRANTDFGAVVAA